MRRNNHSKAPTAPILLNNNNTHRQRKSSSSWDDSISDLASMKATKKDLQRRKVMAKSNNLDKAQRELNRPRSVQELESSTLNILEHAKTVLDNNNTKLEASDPIDDLINSPNTMRLIPAKVAEITYNPNSVSASVGYNILESRIPNANNHSQPVAPEVSISNSNNTSGSNNLSDSQNNGASEDSQFMIKAIGQLCDKVQFLYDEIAREKNKREILEKKMDWMSKRIEVLECEKTNTSSIGVAATSTPIKVVDNETNNLKDDMLKCLNVMRSNAYQGQDVDPTSEEGQRLEHLKQALRGLDNDAEQAHQKVNKLNTLEKALGSSGTL